MESYLETFKAKPFDTEKGVSEKDVSQGTGPEAAVGKGGADLKMVDPDRKPKKEGVEGDHYKTELLSDPSEKTAKESINISDMSDKSN